MSGPSEKTSQTEYDGIVVQSSLMGIAIPRGWGTNKLGCNLIDYLDFNAKKVSTGGKGGGASSSYDYHATLVMAICQGPIFGVRTIYKDSAYFIATGSGTKEVNGTTVTISSQTPIEAAGLSGLFGGALGQAPWPYLTSNHPGHDLGYSGIAYVAAENYDLNTSATTPNHNFEVQFQIRAFVNDVYIDDADAGAIIADIAANVPRFPALGVNAANLLGVTNYCFAQGLFLSPVADEGRQASDLIQEIMDASNLDCFYSEGVLWFVPYGDTTITNNGVTWTPDLTPRYQLTWDDIIPSGKGEDPIQWDVNRTLEAYNYVQVSFTDRTQQYSTNVATAIDQANINEFGKRQAQAVSADSVCDPAVAAILAQLKVQRSANVRRTCEFKVSELFGLLNPMEDLILVPLRNGGTRLVRIVECNENTDDGTIEIKGEEELVSVSHAAEYTRQDALGIPTNSGIEPGDCNPPTIINPPTSLTDGALEVWIATSGGPNWGGANIYASTDDESYQLVGRISQPGRYGVTTSDLPAGVDPDTTDTLGIDLTTSSGALTSASQAVADAGGTFCAVGTEVIAFSTATLTAPFKYNLSSYIRRGQVGTDIADQPSGSLFMVLDAAVGIAPFSENAIGKPFYIKLASFNTYGNAEQDLDICEAYEFTPQRNGKDVGDIDWTDITNIPQVILDYIDSGGTANNTENVGSQTAAEINAALAAIAAQAEQFEGNFDTQEQEISAAADAALTTMLQVAQVYNIVRQNQYTPAGLPMGVTVDQHTTTIGDQTTALSLLGDVSADGSAFNLNEQTVYLGNGVSVADTFNSLETAQANFSSTLTNNYWTAATTSGAISVAESNLTASYGSAITSAVNTEEVARVSADQAISSAVIGTTATLNGQTTSASLALSSLTTIYGYLGSSASLQVTNGNELTGVTVLQSGGGTSLTSGIILQANNLLIRPASGVGAVNPFYYDATLGLLAVQNLAVYGNLIVGGTVFNAVLANGQVTGFFYASDTTSQALGAPSGAASTSAGSTGFSGSYSGGVGTTKQRSGAIP